MEDLTLPFAFRISELLPLARLLRASYLRDQADFHDLLPADYTAQFLTSYDAALATVEQVERSSVSIAERQLITQRLDALLAGLPTLLNRLEARVRRAAGLTVPAKKFGIEAVRSTRNNNEHEGLADALTTLLHNLTANEPALLAKGQTPAETTQLRELTEQLVRESTAQATSVSTQRLLTAANVQQFRALYQPMRELLADGKSLYQTADAAKTKDYTLTQLLKRVRRAPAPEEAAKKA